MFKWTCLVVGGLIGVIMLWILEDIRVHTREQLVKVNEIATVGVAVSRDVQSMRTIGGLTHSDHELSDYAASLLDFIEQQGAQGKIAEDKEMKTAQPMAQWIRGARKEAVALVLTEKSKEGILRRIAKTFPLRRDWYIQLPGATAAKLEDWIRANHEESKTLPQPEK